MPAKKSKYKKLLIVLFWLVPLVFFLSLGMGLGTGYLLWGRNQAANPNNTQRYSVSVDDDPAMGPANAPITIIEFGDFQCGYCRKWHTEVFGKLMAAYPGKIRFVFRDFPLAEQTIPALVAANCANEQAKYWEYNAALFDGQYGYDTTAFLQYAANLGLDDGAFSACLQSEAARQEVIADYNEATSIGVQSTPTFFINGIPVVGAQSFATFKNIIDKELKNR